MPQLSFLYWRSEVIDALGEYGPLATGALPLVRPYLQEEFLSSRVQTSATHFVGRLKDRESVPALVAMLLATDRAYARDEAAYALGAIGDPGTLPILTRVSKKDKVASVRDAAATALKEFGTLWQSR